MSSYNFDDVTSSDGSEEETFELNVSDLRPCDFEPVPSHPVSQPDSNDCAQAISSQTRKGNTHWCKCGKCRSMETEDESKCCKDDGKVPECYFNGKVCITENESFGAVCIQREVLKTVLHMLNNMRGVDINIHNRSLRYAG